MSNRISDADIDAILREFSEQQEQEARAAESAPSRRRDSTAQERSPRRENRPEPRAERSKDRAPQPAPRREPRREPERPKEREARSRPQPPREATPVRPAFSFGYLILIVLSILALVWALVNIHPGTGTNTGSTTENRLDLVGKLDVFMNNSASDALENVAYIRKIYTIPESDLVAPKPDQSKFGSTTDPAVVQAVVDSAAELLEGQ